MQMARWFMPCAKKSSNQTSSQPSVQCHRHLHVAGAVKYLPSGIAAASLLDAASLMDVHGPRSAGHQQDWVVAMSLPTAVRWRATTRPFVATDASPASATRRNAIAFFA